MQGRGGGKTPEKVIELLTSEVKRTSQATTAKSIGLTRLALQRYLKGIGEPTNQSLHLIAKYFETSFTIEVNQDGIRYR